MSIEPTRPPFPPTPPPAPVRAARAAMDATVLEMGAEPLDETAPATSRTAPEIGTRLGSATRSPQAAPRSPSAPPRVVRGEADHGPEFRTPTDRARAALLAGDPSAALEALETQTAGDLLDPEARAAPRSPVAQGLRAQARLDQGEPVAAFDAAARGLAEAPRSLALRWTAAQAAAALGAPDAAAALLAPLVDAAEAAVAERARRDAAPAGTNGSAERASPEGARARQALSDPSPAGTGSRPLLARPTTTVALVRRDAAPASSDIANQPTTPTRESSRDAPGAVDPRITRHVARHRPGAQAYAAAAALETLPPDASNSEGAPAPARVPATTRAALLRLAGGIVAHLGDGSGADGVALFARDAAKRLDGGQGIGEPVREPEARSAASPSESSTVEGDVVASKPDAAAPRASREPSASTVNASSMSPEGPIMPGPSEGMPGSAATTTRRSDVASAAPTSTDASLDDRATAPTDEPQRTSPTANVPPRSATEASRAALPKTSLPEPYAESPTVLDAPVLWRGDRVAAAAGTGDIAHVPRSPALPAASDQNPAAASTPIVGASTSTVTEPGDNVADAAVAIAMDRETLLTALPDDVRRATQDGSAPLLLEESVRRAVGLPARREPDEAPPPASPVSTAAMASERTSSATASSSARAESERARPEPFASLAPGDRSAPHFVAWLAADLASGALPLPPQPPPPIEVFELASDPAGSAARAAAAAQLRTSPSALPMTWRGVLRLALIGAGLLLLAGGRPMLGAVMSAGAVWWWLGDARRTARQATWSTRPTIE